MICERHCNALISWTLFSLILCSPTHAQSISTNTPVPPLQWINITGLIKGSTAAPPLVDASIGYYAGTRTLLVFGGESAQGLPSSQTFLLDLDSLTWSSPPSGNTPPARSAAISGDDIAASYRTAHIVIGGKDSSGNALSDVWEFDYISQIWQQVSLSEGGPSGRYGAVGGYDSRTAAATVPNSPYPNNTFYLAGGIDGSSVSPLSDVWQLNVTGTLSSNNLNDVYGSWEQIPMSGSSAPSKVGAAGAVVSQSTDQIIAAIGGCTTSSASNASCAQADSYIINTQMDSVEALKPCPAPRFGATVVQNHNEFNGAFNTQVFLLLGTVNASLWSDGGGLDRGEVDVFDITTGSWTRILPAGDPGSSGGEPAFPSPRQGAVALSSSQTLVGESRNTASDTIVFGGRDAAGNYLSEVWILRAYNATLTQSNASWSGFGNGQLTGGPDANGQGVTIQYMTQCASPLSPQATQTSSYPSSTPSGIGPGSPTTTSPSSSSPTARYNTSVTHKSLSPISIALVLPAVIIFRLSSPPVSPVNSPQPLGRRMALFYLAAVVGLAAYGIGIAGLATSFTTITSTSSLIKRSSSNVLKTVHGKAGLALFAGFYGLVPLLYLYSIYHRRRLAKRTNKDVNGIGDGRSRVNSSETAEKMGFLNGRAGSPLRQSMDGPSQETHVTEPRPRVRSWGGLGPLTVFPGRRSSESGLESTGASAPSHRSFEVTNRPVRTRRASGNSLAAFSDPRATGTPRNLSDMSWFDRRRSLGTVVRATCFFDESQF
ncbi:hypothetical protein AcW1_004364 [Taiwanofungus camphoratus]|nr:hypothetical protein AcV7_008081 [Antrodia cinnamomea]KAI0959573.1 hypothetical protein AcW1_004364 [Antrodia cinnamomea]